MKKAIVLVVFAVLVFSACDKVADPDNAALPEFLSGPYTFTADYSADGIEGELEFKKSGVEQCELRFLSPDTIKDMTLYLENGSVKTELYGISYQCPIALLAEEYPIVLIYNILSGKGEKPKSVTTDKETGNVVYEYEDGTRLAANEDAPVSIEVPSVPLVLTITSFEKLASAE